MRYEFIEDYSHYEGGGSFTVEGRTLPDPCLIEDEDGIRLFLTGTPSINTAAWLRAHAQSAAALIIVTWDFSAITVESFMEHRTEVDGRYHIDPQWAHPFPHLPSYVELMRSLDGRDSYRGMDSSPAPSTMAGRFVHLHAHSEFSALDGLSRVEEMVDAVVADEQPALAITDHGVCGAHPALANLAKKAGIKPIYGIEAYFVDDRRWRPMDAPTRAMVNSDEEWERLRAFYEEQQRRGRDYWHLVLWAQDDVGLQNIWSMATESHRDESFHYKPRMDWDVLERHSDGVIVSTACLRGPISRALLQEDDEQALARLSRLHSIFDDRVYLELHTNHLDEQVKVNQRLIEVGRQTGTGLVVVSDSHYPTAAHQQCHRTWMAVQTNSDLADDPTLFAGNQDYHLLTADEVVSAIDYLPADVVSEAMDNTVSIAASCTAEVNTRPAVWSFSKEATPELSRQRDVERLTDLCISNWHKVENKREPFEVYAARFEREMDLLIDKGFCWYFLMVADYCGWARSQGILVGPGRGSGGGSLVAYLCNITEIDPVDADLMFERFLTKGRTSLPDFDIDFPASKRDVLTRYVQDRYGEDRVVRIGTHIRSKNKATVKDLARVLKGHPDIDIHYPDIEAINKIIDDSESDTAGLGKPWEAVLEDEAEVLAPYITKYPLLFELAEKLSGRLKTYGKHPAGLVISLDESLTDSLPLVFDDGVPISMFDMDAVEKLGMVKFDLLTLRTFDTLQTTVDLISARHGKRVDPYNWREEYLDQAVWQFLSEGHTLGIFQAETPGMTRLTMQFQPKSLSEMADVVTLIRPGPKRSGLTDTYFRRKAGEEPVSYPHPVLEPILSKSYGCIIYQEDVMQATMLLAGYTEDEADEVRRLLGKKKVELVNEAGEKFRAACREMGVIDEQGAAVLWDQMAEFAKYSFNRAHAYAYAVIAFWCAWFKYYYPAEFLVGVLAHVDGKRIPDFVSEARRRGFKVLPPDINESGQGFTIVSDDVVRYGLGALAGIGDSVCAGIIPHQPFTSFEDFLERKGASVNMGHVKTLVSVGAFDQLVPNRRALEERLSFEGGDGQVCRWKDEGHLGPNGLPCTFDWSSVPVEMTSKGVPKKNQRGAPKRCTRGCWKYDPNQPPDFDALAPYTAKQIRDREKEILGLYLSSTPFEVIPADGLAQCATVAELQESPEDDTYLIACLLSRIKEHTDRRGQKMAFLDLTLHDGLSIDAVCFSSLWKSVKADAFKDRLALAIIRKTHSGYTLVELSPL